ncbi:MAG TPA: hypothetical protein VLT36_25370, partial [Candidatus Dormibacteraeota bacterium]|nr:hypothetical protein [Candidatus Dormibacteraeota bacterium]
MRRARNGSDWFDYQTKSDQPDKSDEVGQVGRWEGGAVNNKVQPAFFCRSRYNPVMRLLLLCCLLTGSWPALGAVHLVNNQPFPIRMPFYISATDSRQAKLSGSTFQQSGTNFAFIAQVGANSEMDLRAEGSTNQNLRVTAVSNGLGVTWAGQALGELEWGIVVHDAKRERGETDGESTKADFNAKFEPLPLAFKQTEKGPVFELWTATAEHKGLELAIEGRTFRAGFLELNARLVNRSADRTTNVYAAVVCRWEQTAQRQRSFCYDNHIMNLVENAWSPFRQGEGRHLFVQRGVDWCRTSFSNGTTIAWLNDFAPSFTVETPATAKTPAHYTGANLPQLGQEIQTAKTRVYSITEIARSTIRSYRDRLKENILPARGEGVSFRSELVFGG